GGQPCCKSAFAQSQIYLLKAPLLDPSNRARVTSGWRELARQPIMSVNTARIFRVLSRPAGVRGDGQYKGGDSTTDGGRDRVSSRRSEGRGTREFPCRIRPSSYVDIPGDVLR